MSKTKTKLVTIFGIFTLIVSLFSSVIEPKPAQAGEFFTLPITPWEVTQDGGAFGDQRQEDVYHLGDDIAMPAGTNVYAFAEGIVRHIGIHTRFGTVILIEHQLGTGEKIVSLYGHLRISDVEVSEGQRVSKGQLIGHLGEEGAENGYWTEHLHFGIRKGGYQTTWVYWGMGSYEEMQNWYNPSEFMGLSVKTQRIVDQPPSGAEAIVDPFADGKIIAGPGYGGRPHIRVINTGGEPYKELDFFAYESDTKAGADVAIGDVDGDKKDDIIIGRGPKEEPYVSVFDKETHQEKLTFLAYAKTFKGGVRVATGDINGDGKDEIITGAGPGGGAQVRVFDQYANVIFGKLFPFGEEQNTGCDVAAGDLNGDNIDEIIVASGPGESAHIRYYYGTGTLSETDILAFPEAFTGGAHVSTGDIDKDGIDEIIAGAGPGGGPQIRVFEADGTPRGIQFFPFHYKFQGGIDVASIDFDNDGKDEIVASQFSKGQSWIKVYRYNDAHTILANFMSYNQNFEGGTNVAGKQ